MIQIWEETRSKKKKKEKKNLVFGHSYKSREPKNTESDSCVPGVEDGAGAKSSGSALDRLRESLRVVT